MLNNLMSIHLRSVDFSDSPLEDNAEYENANIAE